ncbi:MAG: V-type ATP synthase subunit F [Candidatus Wallbacteria bacterium]|nr:V-type ATP synthase subunit F [Candidatus Wallbacteria bacterium]
MQAKVIGDLSLVMFFGSVGFPGVVVENSEKARELLLTELKNPNTGVIILPRKFAGEFSDEVASINLRGEKIIFTFPDPENPAEDSGVAKQIMRFLGVNL